MASADTERDSPDRMRAKELGLAPRRGRQPGDRPGVGDDAVSGGQGQAEDEPVEGLGTADHELDEGRGDQRDEDRDEGQPGPTGMRASDGSAGRAGRRVGSVTSG